MKQENLFKTDYILTSERLSGSPMLITTYNMKGLVYKLHKMRENTDSNQIYENNLDYRQFSVFTKSTDETRYMDSKGYGFGLTKNVNIGELSDRIKDLFIVDKELSPLERHYLVCKNIERHLGNLPVTQRKVFDIDSYYSEVSDDIPFQIEKNGNLLELINHVNPLSCLHPEIMFEGKKYSSLVISSSDNLTSVRKRGEGNNVGECIFEEKNDNPREILKKHFMLMRGIWREQLKYYRELYQREMPQNIYGKTAGGLNLLENDRFWIFFNNGVDNLTDREKIMRRYM